MSISSAILREQPSSSLCTTILSSIETPHIALNRDSAGKLTPNHIRSAIDGRILIITGAGVSADSGLQTFRGTGGLWRNFNPMELATPEAFARDPKLVWEWYQWRRSEAAKTSPNPAHLALAEVARKTRDCLIAKQNVDDLHERAQTPAERLVHVHGDLFRNRCQRCTYSDRQAIDSAICLRTAQNVQLDYYGLVWFGLARCLRRRCCGKSITLFAPANARSLWLLAPPARFTTSSNDRSARRAAMAC